MLKRLDPWTPIPTGPGLTFTRENRDLLGFRIFGTEVTGYLFHAFLPGGGVGVPFSCVLAHFGCPVSVL